MQPILLHPIIFYFLLFFEVLLIAVIFWIFMKFWHGRTYDYIIFLDKSNRWKLVRDKIGNSSTYTHNEKKYVVSDNVGILNKKGRSLYIFSEGKPQGLQISYNDAKWLSADSLMSVINNKLIQKLVQTTDAFFDKLVLFGAIGGMIAGIASVIILLKQFGMI